MTITIVLGIGLAVAVTMAVGEHGRRLDHQAMQVRLEQETDLYATTVIDLLDIVAAYGRPCQVPDDVPVSNSVPGHQQGGW